MAPTLQDVAMLLGLPLAGAAVGPRVVGPMWMHDMVERFADVEREPGLGDILPHPEQARGPAKNWLLQFQVNEIMCY